MASLTMIMNYSHTREYDNVTFPPNIVMTYFHQMDKWQLGICWTDMMMMARMRLVMTIMMLIVTRTGGENDHWNVGDKSTFVSLLSMLLEALVGCKLPSCSSSIGAAAKISSCQVVQEADRIICGDNGDLFTFNSVHHIGRLHSPSWNIWDVIDTGKRFEEVLQPSSASAEC